MAIRDMDIAAELIGIRPMEAKLTAFAVSSFYVGMAGSLYFGIWLGAAEPIEAFGIEQSFLVLFMVIIGGLGSILGSFLGAAFHYVDADIDEKLHGRRTGTGGGDRQTR